MKHLIIKLILLSSIIWIGFLVLEPKVEKKHTQTEMDNISKVLQKKFAEAEKQVAKTAEHPKQPVSNQESIIGVIYKRPETTWFFKAKDNKEKIDSISASFKNYFVDQLKFDTNQQPVFDHIPEKMKVPNTSSMRVATFMLESVEISVSRLAGDQDVSANVKRWMRQIGIKDLNSVALNYLNDEKVIIVKIPK